MRGPPPQPVHLKLLRGNPGKRALKQEVQPETLEQLPEPPDFLHDDAKAEWRRLIGEMVRLKLVTPLDTMLFSVYCQSFADWKAAVEAFNRMGAKDPVMAGLLIKDRDGEARTNPLVRIVRNAGEHMVRAASEFGLTPVARARVASAGFGFEPTPGGGKFDGLLG
jgi:P27 family predicted phage terminase small subunit